jgi:hypothetical protein
LHDFLFFSKLSSSKTKQTLQDLQSSEPSKILEAVSSLAGELALFEEGLFGGGALDVFIPELVRCLKMKDFPEIMGI